MDNSDLAGKRKELEAVCKEYHPGISCRVTESSPLYEETVSLEFGDVAVPADKIYVYIHVPEEAKEVPISQLANRLQAFDYVGRVYQEFFKKGFKPDVL